MRRIRRVGLGIGPILLSACLIDIDADRLLDAGPPDGQVVIRPDGGVAAPCPLDTVEIGGGVCVDAREASRGAYVAFLVQHGSEAGTQSGPCRFNDSYLPEDGWPPAAGTDALPVAGLDWCDALAFCAASGRRLCTEAEWSSACSRGSISAYPYGSTYMAGRCNGDGVAPEPLPTGSLASCEGGFAGLFDLSGNVAEWVDGCVDGPGASGSNDDCAALGGSYASIGAALSCSASQSAWRSHTSPSIGLRCCRSR
ncbi:MAG: SUMF1/EgtB/PvdO family nonheme iron enzyme [Deltaproteobacteria bacterium]|nr:SUMF1/EgtB/PvdO family nonheme iron enzyme [Deltaproteobacteria bacterium]